MNLRYASIMIASMFALLVTTGVVAIAAELSKYADPCEWVALSLCAHETGQTVERFSLSGFKTSGSEDRLIADIMAVIPLTTADKCVLILTKSLTTAVVEGSRDEVMLKLNPPGCKK